MRFSKFASLVDFFEPDGFIDASPATLPSKMTDWFRLRCARKWLTGSSRMGGRKKKSDSRCLKISSRGHYNTRTFFADTAENESSEERRTRKIQDCVPMQDCAMQDCAASHSLLRACGGPRAAARLRWRCITRITRSPSSRSCRTDTSPSAAANRRNKRCGTNAYMVRPATRRPSRNR